MNKQKLKAKMVETGVKQRTLAEELDINQATLSRKMNGDSQFTLDELKTIIKVLGLTKEEFGNIFFAA